MRAVHPDVSDTSVQATFVINGVTASPDLINLSIPRNYMQNLPITLSTGVGTSVDNLRLVYEAADQPSGLLADGIHLDPGQPLTSLVESDTATIELLVWADNQAPDSAQLFLKVTNDQGEWGLVEINATFGAAAPALTVSPAQVETGVALNDSVTETVTLGNSGLTDLKDVVLSLVDESGAPAPAWLSLVSASGIGDIPAGESVEAALAAFPGSSVVDGVYSFFLRAEASNHQAVDTLLTISVVQEGVGSVQFKVSDIYTGTLDGTGQIIQGLASATITVRNENVPGVEQTLSTDAFGEAIFSDLPAGSYISQSTAADHTDHFGRFTVKSGLTVNQDILLDYNLVTVEWQVVETSITDQYEVVLSTTYEVDVPAAVVVASPASVTLPDMEPGDVFTGEIVLTNHGLIRADNFEVELPTNDAYYHYEVLETLPDKIEPGASITVPYQVICLEKLYDASSSGGASGCSYQSGIAFSYNYICTSGVATSGRFSTSFGKSWGCNIDHEGNLPTFWSYNGTGVGSNGGGRDSFSLASDPLLTGPNCPQNPPDRPYSSNPCDLREASSKKRNRVELMRGTVLQTVTDLRVKIPGGRLSMARSYYDHQWHFSGLGLEDIQININAAGIVQSINKGWINFTPLDQSHTVFGFGAKQQIMVTGSGFRWQHNSGLWQEFDVDGRMTARGDRRGTLSNMIYDGTGLLTAINDRKGSQILAFEYDDVDANLIAVHDQSARSVIYTYTGGLLTQVTDPLGHNVFYAYDQENRLTSKTDQTGQSMTITYAGSGYVSSVLNDAGQGEYYDYLLDSSRNEYYTRITHTSGKIREVWLNSDGKRVREDLNGRTVKSVVYSGNDQWITDANGNLIVKEYDEWDNLVRTLYADGSEVVFAYAPGTSLLTSRTDEKGIITTYDYDESDNLITKVEGTGTTEQRTTRYAYDLEGNRLSQTVEGDGATSPAMTLYTYDAFGNVASITDPEGSTTIITYDMMGNVLTRTDGRGKEWTFTYDQTGHLFTSTDPLGNVSQRFYDPLGNLVSVIDPLGRKIEFTYDQKGNRLSMLDAGDGLTRYEYNDDDKLLSQIDPEGKVVYFEYDLDGRLIKVMDGSGNETIMDYDGSGTGCSSCLASNGSSEQPSLITYPTFSKTMVYDLRGRKISEIEDLGTSAEQISSMVYDAGGLLLSSTDRNSNQISHEYDNLGRLVRSSDPMGGETLYGYDVRDNLVSLTDGAGNVTTFQYDRNNRLVKEIRPLGQETVYEYDANGNLTVKTDALGQKIVHVYDDAGRRVESQEFNSTDYLIPIKTVAYSYDKADNLTGYEDGTVSAVYSYDAMNRKIGETVNYPSFTLSWSQDYYVNGMKKSFIGPDGAVQDYGYDASNQLTSVGLPGHGTITWHSYTWTQPDKVTLPGGGTREYGYDPLLRVSSIQANDPFQAPVMDYQYSRDNEGNIMGKTTEHGDYSYTYDLTYRLTDAVNPATGDEVYDYDGVGNRLADVKVAGPWSYSGNNELQDYGDTTLSYDNNGNMGQKSVAGVLTNFIYDISNRLIRVEDGNATIIAEYGYDPFGRRIWKEVREVRTYFFYADEGLIGEYDGTGTELKAYGYRPGVQWTTGPLFLRENGTYYFYHNDHLGTPQKLVNAIGQVVWDARYEGFGKASLITEQVVNNVRFPGQYFDTETGLHYNWHRYYNPEIGRYLTADPIGVNGGVNYYNYVESNPVTNTDPIGLFVQLLKCRFAIDSFVKANCSIEVDELFDKYKERLEWCDSVMDYCTGLSNEKPDDCISCDEIQSSFYSDYMSSCAEQPLLDDLFGNLSNAAICAKKAFDVIKQCRTSLL